MAEHLPQRMRGMRRHRVQHQHDGLQRLLHHGATGIAVVAELRHRIQQFHDRGNGGVEGVATLIVVGDLLDGLVQLAAQRALIGAQLGRHCTALSAFRMLRHLRPQAPQEALHAFDASVTPFQALVRRCGEHREQAHRVGAVAVDQRLRINAVVL